MRTAFLFLKSFILFSVFILCFSKAQAQDNTAALKAAIEAKRFAFNAQTVTPLSGAARQVGGQGYQLKLNGDSLLSDLPYFGRAYSAPLTNEGGIKFTSTQFEYIVKKRRKNGWELTLRPKDVSDFREFLLTVFQNGTATLRAMSQNRQPISYNGTVTATQ